MFSLNASSFFVFSGSRSPKATKSIETLFFLHLPSKLDKVLFIFVDGGAGEDYDALSL